MYVWKKRKESKRDQRVHKILSKRTGFPCLRLGGLQWTHKESPFKSEKNQQMIRGEVHGANLSILLSLYPKISAIASGATPIGSAVVHPIEISRQKEITRNFGCITNKTLITPIGRCSQKVKKDNSKSCVYLFSQTRLRNIILELRHRDETWMSWLKYITKVRPQDPSCVARYTHMDALCWYVSVSTTRRKILMDALGTLRTTGIHSL
jgi:hypothetical protein